MDKIPSFQKNHDEIKPGLYLCGASGDVYTYDLRFKKPNSGDYISPAASHSIEHILATILRNSSQKDKIVYFGPMGCRTGFYLLARMEDFKSVLNLLIESLEAVNNIDEIPGGKREECGNCKEHDLLSAKEECARYLNTLKLFQNA